MEISIDIWRQLFFLLLKISKQTESVNENSAAENIQCWAVELN